LGLHVTLGMGQSSWMNASCSRIASTISVIAFIAAVPACTLNTQGDNFNQGSSASTAPNPAGGGGGQGGGQGGAGGAGGEGGGAGAAPVCPEQCPDPVPAGWVRVGYAPDRSTPCPSGFIQADITTDAVLQADACVCGNCQVTTQPSCDSGEIKTYNTSPSGNCKEAGVTFANSPAGQCANILQDGSAISPESSFGATPPPPVGGACSRAALLDTSKIQWAEGRLCLPMATTCDSEVCAGIPSFSECVLADGDNQCPAPFSTRYVTGTDDNVKCEACGCTLNSTCQGTLTLYTDKTCTAGGFELSVDGLCYPLNSNTSYYTYKYTGEVKLIKCADAPTIKANFIPAQTICCK
jgi:hypothetical protein